MTDNETAATRPRIWRRRFASLFQTIVSLAILFAGIAALIALKLSAEKPPTRDVVDLSPEVTTYAVDEFRGELDLDVNGMVVPSREIKVAVEVAGRVAEKTKDFQAGQYVKAGTLLLSIDPREYEIEVRRLGAEVEQAQRMFEETEQELAGAIDRREVALREFEVQQAEYDRRRNIADVLSQSELNQSEQNLLASRAALQTHENTVSTLEKRKARMEAAIDLSKLHLEKANLDLQRTAIKAPVDGVVVSEQVEMGDFVQRGQQVLLFEDTEHAEIRCNLTLNQLKWIFQNSPGSQLLQSEQLGTVYQLPKTPVSITSPNDPRTVWQGRLERFDGIGLDERTKTIPCTVVVDNPIAEGSRGRQALVRGTYVKCRIVIAADQMVDQGKRFVRFPEVAVQPGGYVWLVQQDKLKRHPVEIVDHAVAESVEGLRQFVVAQLTETSLQPGARVVTSPLASPVEGIEVREMPESTAASAASSAVDAEHAPGEPQPVVAEKVQDGAQP